MTNKIYVSNISPSTTDKDLFGLFSNSGEVISVKINFGIDNKTIKSVYIIMNSEENMQKAVSKNNNVILNGSRIKVVKAHPIDQNNSYISMRNRSYKFYKK